MEITARNVNEILPAALYWLKAAGVEENSRNGKVIVSPEPVLTTYDCPTERVLFSPLRDANPFFHFMEALWILAGRQDLAFPVYFNKNFAQYSDDGIIHPGAYGYRWRNNFGFDQIPIIVEELKRNPESRRCVLQMWDCTDQSVEIDGYNPRLVGSADLYKAMHGGKDVPCNTHAYVDCRDGALNITVMCRSNDIWWGCYGANVVQFSTLQEYLSAAVGVPVGVYRQFSNNFHIYTNVLPRERFSEMATDAEAHNYYDFPESRKEELRKLGYAGTTVDTMNPYPLVSVPIEQWDADLALFMESPAYAHPYFDKFFTYVARPMYLAWEERKEKRGTGLSYAAKILAPDWRRACVEWIERREARKAEAK